MPRRPVRPGHRRGDPKWAVNTLARESKRARVPPSVTPVAKTRCTEVVSRNTKSPGAAPVSSSMQPLNTRFPSWPGTTMGMQWYDAATDAVKNIMLSSAPITTCRGVFQSAEGCCADPQRAAITMPTTTIANGLPRNQHNSGRHALPVVSHSPDVITLDISHGRSAPRIKKTANLAISVSNAPLPPSRLVPRTPYDPEKTRRLLLADRHEGSVKLASAV